MSNILWIDLETTSLTLHKAKIVSIGLIYKGKSTNILVNPNIHIPSESSNIHGITDDMVKDKKSFNQIAPNIMNLLIECDAIGGYNYRKYDQYVLAFELLRCGYELPDKQILDVYELIYDLEKSKKLKDVYLRMCGKSLDNAHNSLSDITASKELYDYIIKKFYE